MLLKQLARQRRANRYITLLSIAHNPYAERPSDLFDEFTKEAYPNDQGYIAVEKPDYDGLDNLKGLLSGGV